MEQMNLMGIDPVSALIALVALATTVLFEYQRRSETRREITCTLMISELISEETVAAFGYEKMSLTIGDNNVRGTDVSSVMLIKCTFKNTGRQEISADEIRSALGLKLNENAKILLLEFVSKPHYTATTHDIKLEATGNRVRLSASYLHSGDTITFRLLVLNGNTKNVQVKGKITGTKGIRLRLAEKERNFDKLLFFSVISTSLIIFFGIFDIRLHMIGLIALLVIINAFLYYIHIIESRSRLV